MANTQIIPSFTQVDLESRPPPPAPAAGGAAAGAAGKKLASTSVPPGGSGKGPEKGPDERNLEEEDRELLAELKSVINKKFDELLK